MLNTTTAVSCTTIGDKEERESRTIWSAKFGNDGANRRSPTLLHLLKLHTLSRHRFHLHPHDEVRKATAALRFQKRSGLSKKWWSTSKKADYC
jgi:hypothetical protein